MIRKIVVSKWVITGVLLLVVFGAVFPMLAFAMDATSDIVAPPSNSAGGTVEDVPIVTPGEQGNPYGYELSFTEEFFSDLSAAGVEMYVDGRKVDAMPESGSMKALYVHFVYAEELEPEEERLQYALDVDNQDFDCFFDTAWTGCFDEHFIPMVVLLRGDVTFMAYRIK